MNNYEENEILGKGSFGLARLCTRKTDGKEVVIKFITSLSKKEQASALTEIRILGSLEHPNVIRYIESFEDQSSICIVTEYAEEGDLHLFIRSRVNNKKHITEDEAMSVSTQVCMALKYLHANKILHRDLKPANIFLSRGMVVTLGDFGVATVLKATQNMVKTFCGTIHYLSPEVCEEQPYNNKADLWAAGCCLYEMLTLRRAFEAKSVLQMGLNICAAKYEPLGENISEDVKNLVSHLLVKKPTLRYNAGKVLTHKAVINNLNSLPRYLKDNDRYRHVFGELPNQKCENQYEIELRAMEEWAKKDAERLEIQEKQDALLLDNVLKKSGDIPSLASTMSKLTGGDLEGCLNSSTTSNAKSESNVENHRLRNIQAEVASLMATKEEGLSRLKRDSSNEDFTDDFPIFTKELLGA